MAEPSTLLLPAGPPARRPRPGSRTDPPAPPEPWIRARVDVIASDEVLRWALHAMAASLAGVDAVRSVPHPCRPAAESGRRAADLVLTTGADLRRWPGLGARCTEIGAKVLVVLDDLDTARMPPADGYLARDGLAADGLARAVDRCLAGEVPMPAAVARALVSGAATPPADPGGRRALTSRECQALALLADGLSNDQMARRMGISTHGVKRLVSSLMIKLDAANRTTAVASAIRAGLVG